VAAAVVVVLVVVMAQVAWVIRAEGDRMEPA
jgi:hypothetical protein